MTTLILASQSPARTRLLNEAGIVHSVLVSGVDEDAVDGGAAASPAELAQILARAKAEAVAALPESEGALVLGCDSVFELDGQALGKPYTQERAVERLRGLSGRTGVLHTGHWLADRRGGSMTGSGALRSALVSFVTLREPEIFAYAASGEPLHCAGSFTIDGLGGAFIERVDGDPHTVVGLSISALRELLAGLGVPIVSLWGAQAPLSS